MRRLKAEILNINSAKKNHVEVSHVILDTLKPNQQKTNIDASNWSELQVIEWAKNVNINNSIIEDLKPCNGKILNQLFKILTTAPEFFYCALTAKNRINLRDVAVFTSELEILFKTHLL